jgi:putative methionine-R-sulfoxide reductase with GAF domain
VQAAPPVSAYLLAQRDEEPSDQSPLVYRERTWVVPPGTSEEAAAGALRGELFGLQQQLAGRPDGKFVNLAVFDHPWKERPQSPPLVTLQWKDWRGEPELAFPARDRAARTKSTPSSPPDAKPGTTPPPSVATAPGAMAPVPPAVAASAPPAAPVPPAAAALAPPAATPAFAPPKPAASAPTPVPPARKPASAATIAESPDDRLAQAFEACQDLFFLSSAVDGLDFAVRLLDEIVPCEAITASLYDIDTNELRLVVLTGPGADARRGSAVPSGRGLCTDAALRPVAILVDDVSENARYDAEVDGRPGLDAQTMLLHSVMHEGRLLGLLQLTNRAVQPQFGRADANVVAYVAKALGEFLYAQRTADKRAPAGTTVARPRR